MTPEQFASGEVTYLLNEGITDGSQHWYQTIGTGTPAFTGETVYQGYVDCENQMYSNQPVGTEPNHSLIEVVDDQYLKSEASCMSAAVYYKVCETCGTVSNTETFTFGESLPHSFNSATGMCEVCGQDIAVAKVTLGEETIFYQTFADAVAAAEEGTT